MRLAWFTPLPPVRSGVAAYNAELLPHLRHVHDVDCFVDGHAGASHSYDAHEFLWRQRLEPYDLVVYQLGNAPCHDYMWGYLAAYPGLVILHDARLHHARARCLLSRNRAADYRAEFAFDHPDAVQDFTEYAVEGLGGAIYSLWSMLRVVVATARMVAVHNPRVKAALAHEYPDAAFETLRMGVPALRPVDAGAEPDRGVRQALAIPDHACVFVAFGKMTAEKRIGAICRAFEALVADGVDAYLLLVGDAAALPALGASAASDRVRVAGYVDEHAIGGYLAAADVCLCLRWPTALETSAAWLRALAARRPTVISGLAHLADVPAIDPRRWRRTHAGQPPVAVTIDLLDEDHSLLLAMQRLAADPPLRHELASAGHHYWARDHTLETMTADYRRVIAAAAATDAPRPSGLPAHITEDYSAAATAIARRFEQVVDILA